MIDPNTVIWDPCDVDPDNPNLEGAAFFAYLSGVDQATSDAEFHPGLPDWKGLTELCGEDPLGMSPTGLRLLIKKLSIPPIVRD
jgi:hypothetical protein